MFSASQGGRRLKQLRGLAEGSKQDDHGYDTAKND
jgi:hypothetical protein